MSKQTTVARSDREPAPADVDTPEARTAAWGWTASEISNRVLGLEAGPVPQLDADGATVVLFEHGEIVGLVRQQDGAWRCWCDVGRAATGPTVRAAYEAVRA